MSDVKVKTLSHAEVMARVRQFYVEGRCFISGEVPEDRKTLVQVFHLEAGTTVLVSPRFAPKPPVP